MSDRARINIIAFCLGVLIGFAGIKAVQAAEVESIRQTPYEWWCEDSAGTLISGHTRQDKAFQSCYNQALATGKVYFVKGGTFRVTADGSVSPPEPEPDPCEWDASIPADDPACVEPEPEPCEWDDTIPADDPACVPPTPDPEPLVTFGPVSDIMLYPADIGALKQNGFRWVIRANVNRLPTSTEKYFGLASRDESGQNEKGHLSIWVNPDGTVTVRNQDINTAGGGSGNAVTVTSSTVMQPNQEYEIVISLYDTKYVAMWIDNNFEGATTTAYGLADNNLPLILGGLCTVCKLNADPPVEPRYPIDGTVYMEIWNDQIPPPEPTASVEVSWENPTETVEGGPLTGEDALTAINLYQTAPDSRKPVASIDPDQRVHEVTNLYAGTNYCFVATAENAAGESDDSNQVCKTP